MTRILWDAIFLISGSFFTFGAGPSGSAVIEANGSIETLATSAPDASSSNSLTTSGKGTSTANFLTSRSSLFTSEQTNSTATDAAVSLNTSAAAAASRSPTSGSSTTISSTTSTTRRSAATTSKRPVKKFVAAAVRSHFDDCPDSHRHFCFHGTCRFLILEETPACVCHPGFVGMRCEHADLLAVVATNHRKQAVATVLVLCVIGCVLIMVLCSFLHCWWREDCRRRSRAHLYMAEKHGATCYPPESVV
ncbi:PREDICTED: protransforming growth factor alpha [Poecilia mexicana]|uniref:Transforming growth factor, alpha n=2 Tax=Poecilia TaxID=8080 RepID=A0A096MF80_POEFO|nr:PREDICTED: protransforming growth factor alpha [Poecilia formosa]XP_014837595.1 PREDICTED: protransforming growth factor alpha [Poecilia mexicana]